MKDFALRARTPRTLISSSACSKDDFLPHSLLFFYSNTSLHILHSPVHSQQLSWQHVQLLSLQLDIYVASTVSEFFHSPVVHIQVARIRDALVRFASFLDVRTRDVLSPVVLSRVAL